MAKKLSQLLDPSRISLDVRGRKRTAAINEVARMLDGNAKVVNYQGFYKELLARERLDTTCLGNEIALPHARTEHVKDIVMAVGRSNEGVLFENGNQNVKLIFVLGTPKSKPGDYLQVVSLLCRVLKEESTRQALLNAESGEEFMEILAAAESDR